MSVGETESALCLNSEPAGPPARLLLVVKWIILLKKCIFF